MEQRYISPYSANFEQIFNTKNGPDYKPCGADEFLSLTTATDFNVIFESIF